MSDPIMATKGMKAFYGTSQILFGIDLHVEKGDVLAVLGRNGAGKTTTFKTLMGLVPKRSGEFRLAGQNASHMSIHQRARHGLGYVPEDRQVFPFHSVHENLEIAFKPGPDGSRLWTTDEVYRSFPMLEGLRRRLAGRLSGGEQQMLAMGRALMGNPSILLLDEPSEGLAPLIVSSIAEALQSLKQAGLTILIAEQNIHFCMKIASHVAVIHKGQTVFTGPREEFLRDEQITKTYLHA